MPFDREAARRAALRRVGVSHSSRRAHSISDAPASASPSAISSPRPREPPVTIATRPSDWNNSLMVGTCVRLILAPPTACQSLSRTGGRQRTRAEACRDRGARGNAGGGQFLTRRRSAAERVHRARTSPTSSGCSGRPPRSSCARRCCRARQRLYAHDWALTRELLQEGERRSTCCGSRFPTAYGGLGLDKISAAYVGEQIAVNPSFGGSLGAHTSHRHAAARLLRHRRAEGALPAAAGQRRADRRLRPDRAAVGLRRARRRAPPRR